MCIVIDETNSIPSTYYNLAAQLIIQYAFQQLWLILITMVVASIMFSLTKFNNIWIFLFFIFKSQNLEKGILLEIS